MATVGAVWINVLPSMQGFAKNLERQATSAAKVAAAGAGTSMGNAMGDATVGALAKRMTANSRRMQNTFAGSTTAMSRGIANFTAGLRSADAAASAFTGRMGSLGGATRTALNRGVAPLGEFTAGFRSADAAAMALTGRMGTFGGVAGGAFRNLQAGWDGADASVRSFSSGLGRVGAVAGRAFQPFVSGFRDADIAASTFSGRMGTLGGVVRSGVDAGVRSVSMLGTGLRTAGTTAVSAFGAMRTGVATAFSGVSAAASGVAAAGAGAASQMGSAFSSAASTAGSTIRNVLGGAIGQVTAMLGVIGLGTLGSQIASVASGASQTEAQLTALYGAAGAGADQVNVAMDGMASRFRGMDMSVMRDGATSLAYMGLQGEDALGVLERMEAATRAAGSGAVGMDRAFAALTKGVNSGKFQMVELNQISDAGIPIYDALADVLGVDIPTAQAMATDGAIGLEEVLQALSGDHGTWFPALIEGAENMDRTFSGAWDTIKNTIVNGFAEQLIPLFDRAGPKMLQLADKIEDGFSALPGVIGRVRDVFSQLMQSTGLDQLPALFTGTIVPAVRDLWTAVQPLAVIIGGVLVVGVRAVMESLKSLGPVITSVTGFLADNRKWVTLVGVAILGGVAAYYALGVASAVVRAITSVTKIWTVAQWALNAALNANPISLIVIAIAALVAGAIYAYKNFEGFRNVVDTVWQAIKNAAMWIWERGLKPAFEGIMVGVRWVGDAVMWLWNSAIKPAWDAIVGAFDATKSGAGSALEWLSGAFTAIGEGAIWLWEKAIKPAFDFIWALIKNIITLIIVVVLIPWILAFKAIGAIATWLWEKVLKPVFNWIGDAALWLWEKAIKPAWDFIIGGVKQVGQWFKWLWENGIKPAINWIADGAKWLWEKAIKPAWDFIVGGVKELAKWFKWLWNQIKAVFNWIAGHIRTWWNRTRAQFNLVVRFVRNTLATAFTWFRDRVIRPVWDFISNHINNIWNNGIKPAFDKVKEGVKAMQTAFNTGRDAIKKAWEGIRDSAKTPVNFLIDTVYNKGIMPLWNKVAGVVGATELSEVSTFATGGPVYGAGTATSDSIPALLSNNEHVWTAREVNAAGGHSAVESLRAQARAGGSMYARGGRVGFPNAPTIPSGKRILDALADFVSPSGLFSAGVDLITGNYTGAVDRVLKPARDITAEIGTKGLPGTPHLVVKKGGDMIKDKITSLVESYNSSIAAVGGGADSWVGLGSASERLQRAASWARTQHGLPYQWGGGGNPSWDCSGFMAGIENVIRGIRPGRRYTTHSFAGTPPVGWQRGLRSPFTVGVQHGGRGGGHMAGTLMGVNVESGGRGVQVGRGARGTRSFPHQFGFKPVATDRVAGSLPGVDPTLYDRGGYVQPGMSLVSNRSGAPEPVLTAAQWRDMHALAKSVGASEGGELMRDAHIHLENSEATVQEAFRRLDTELRKRRRGGVHAGRVGG